MFKIFKRDEWIYNIDPNGNGKLWDFVCPRCGYIWCNNEDVGIDTPADDGWKYCPKCGKRLNVPDVILGSEYE